MFTKILIANRGEIAYRIMRTCQRLNIRTVAVYSEADVRALHVDMADESYGIGPPSALQSYLKSQTIIDVARASGAQAIHPGYGFLSENADFAAAVEAAGLTFIGPSSAVIRMMGDKLHAKEMAAQAQVPLVPGSKAAVSTIADVKALAAEMGYPVLLKAAAGGGGKGMRVVEREADIADHLERVIHEATSSFGDGRIFVEKYLDSPRHIEIQILADSYGTVLHLGERDCSLQRRHQKVIEESPSPFVSNDLRRTMTDQAVALARHVGYVSAGTVEFMVTSDQDFYFLEMNTRLQVEHPVTEMVTGIDLVEQMIRIAARESLSLTQEAIRFSGHAIEARVYAEDADQDFMPSSGRITRFNPPDLLEGLRLETGVEAGAEASIFYDPLLAKVIAHAPTRTQAIERLQHALAHFVIEGPTHNARFLERLLRHPQVVKGDFSTYFIGSASAFSLTASQTQIAQALAVLLHHRANKGGLSAQWVIVGQEESAGQGVFARVEGSQVFLGKCQFVIDLITSPGDPRFTAIIEGETCYGQAHCQLMTITLDLFGMRHAFQVMLPKVWELSSHVRAHAAVPDSLVVKAPMPGILVRLPIAVGDRVKAGQTLAVIEAMKMENALKSPAEAIVKDIHVHQGDSLTRNQALVTLR